MKQVYSSVIIPVIFLVLLFSCEKSSDSESEIKINDSSKDIESARMIKEYDENGNLLRSSLFFGSTYVSPDVIGPGSMTYDENHWLLTFSYISKPDNVSYSGTYSCREDSYVHNPSEHTYYRSVCKLPQKQQRS